MKYLFSNFRFDRNLRRLAQKEAVEGKPVNIMKDGVFKAMLTQKNEDSREALRSLISACIHREVKKVQVKNNELASLFQGAKSPRLDVHVMFNDGESADIEMQTSKTDDDLKRRAEFCACMLVSNQKTRGKPYKTIKRVYQIFFFNFELFPQSSKLCRRYFYQEEDEHDRLSDLTEIIFYELPKLKKFLKENQTKALTSEEKWCIYLKYRHNKKARPLIEKICQEEAGIMRAEKIVTKVSFSERIAALRLSAKIGEMDRFSALYFAREKGMAQGMAQGMTQGMVKGRAEGEVIGIAKGKVEDARKLKAFGDSPEKIHAVTGLSLEEIEKL